MKKKESIKNLVVVSDSHCGCRMGLCPAAGIALDEGAFYKPTALQVKVWGMWNEFWDEWVPRFCRNEPYAVVVNGDAMDGIHHGSVTQVSQNLIDQKRIAMEVFAPVVEKCSGRLYFIRGTEAHVGKSGQLEEDLAETLGAVPDKEGRYARWELWMRVGFALVHLTHHIGTTGSMAYETSAVQKELEQLYVESARWEGEKPDVLIRSHRHRNIEARIRITKNGRPNFATSCVTAGWQLKTPFAYKVAGGRRSRPQIGGTVVRCGDEEVYTRHQVWDVRQYEIEVCEI